MLESLTQSLPAWATPGFFGSWASIFTLVASVYSLYWVRRTHLHLKRDRQKQGMALPEVHRSLLKAERYVRRQPDDDDRSAVLGTLNRAAYAVEQLFEKVYRDYPGDNAFLVVARFYRKIGDVDLAIFHYKKATACLEPRREGLSRFPPAAPNVTGECLRELQTCYLAAWQLKAAVSVVRRAKDFGCQEDLIPEAEIESLRVYPRCMQLTIEFLVRDLIAKLTRRKIRV